jgi:predicted RNA-binding Zn-ribbon protein involved in translation (DUF1610 family)
MNMKNKKEKVLCPKCKSEMIQTYDPFDMDVLTDDWLCSNDECAYEIDMSDNPGDEWPVTLEEVKSPIVETPKAEPVKNPCTKCGGETHRIAESAHSCWVRCMKCGFEDKVK